MNYGSFYWKQKSRAALRGHWQTALLICLVVNLPSLLIQGIASVTGYDLTSRIQDALYASLTTAGALDAAAFQTRMDQALQTPGVWVMQGLYVLSWLMIPCLVMGMYSWMLGRLRGREGALTDVFSRGRLFLKGMGLRLYVVLRMLLFMLPGIILAGLSLLPIHFADPTSRESVLSSVNTSMTMLSVSSVLMAVLGVMGALYYALSEIVMSENPEAGIAEAARKSRELMHQRRAQLFFLYLSFILWYFLELFLTSFVLGAFGSIAGLMTEMLCTLALNAYISTTVCAFYLTLQPDPGEESGMRQADDGEEADDTEE